MYFVTPRPKFVFQKFIALSLVLVPKSIKSWPAKKEEVQLPTHKNSMRPSLIPLLKIDEKRKQQPWRIRPQKFLICRSLSLSLRLLHEEGSSSRILAHTHDIISPAAVYPVGLDKQRAEGGGMSRRRTGSRCLVNIPLYSRPSHFQSDFYNFLFEKSFPRLFILLRARIYAYTCLSGDSRARFFRCCSFHLDSWVEFEEEREVAWLV